MNCDSVRDVLPLYLSGELRDEEAAQVKFHLRECSQCAMAALTDSELDSALRTAILEETPDVSEVLGRVRERIAASSRKGPRPVSVWMVGMTAIAAIAVFVLIALPRFYMHQVQKNTAMAAADDHYQDLVLLRHQDWEYKPEDVTRFLRRQFPQKRNLLSSITPEGAVFEKVRLCNLRGSSYAHFIFRAGGGEISIFLLPNPDGSSPVQAGGLNDREHGLDVAGFSSAGLTGMVVGQHSSVPTLKIADQLSGIL